MAIPIIPNPIPQWTGATGGDIAGAFMSAFQASNNMRLQNQQAGMQAEQFGFEKSLWPLKTQQAQLGIEAQKLGIDATRQNMGFAAEDQQFQRDEQAWQAQQRQHELDVLRPLNDAVARNRVVSTAYEIEGQRQTLDANTSKMANELSTTRMVEDSLAGLSNFAQTLKSAPAEMPSLSGKASSYGYAGDKDNGFNSLGMKRGEQPWYGQHPTVALSPKTASKLGVSLPKKTDSGWDLSDSYVDVEVGGKKIKAVFDEHGMYINPVSKTKLVDLTPEASDALGLQIGVNVDGVTVRKSGVSQGANPVAGMNAGPVTPDQINRALQTFDTLVNTAKNLPPSSPARIRAEIGISTAINDPTFSGILQQREIQKQNVAQGAAVANNLLSMPVDATASFKARFPQFSDVVVVPTAGGGYDIGRRTQSGVMPMSLPEKVAFNTAYEGFAKKYKEDGPDEISATTLRDYSRQVQILAASKKLPPTDKSDAAEKVRMQALGAEEAINVMEQLNPALRGWRQSISPETMPRQQQGDGVAAPAKKPIPKPGQQQAKQDTALLQAKAVDAVRPKLEVLHPDNGKDDPGLNPALKLAISIFNDERTGPMPTKTEMAMATEVWQPNMPELFVDKSLKDAGIKDDDVPEGMDSRQAAKLWAKKVLDKYDYDTSGGSFEEKPAEYKAAFSGVMSKVGAAPAQ